MDLVTGEEMSNTKRLKEKSYVYLILNICVKYIHCKKKIQQIIIP